MRRTRWTRHTRERFLACLAELGNVSGACALVGLSRSRAYALRGEDPAFAAAWDEAEEIATDALEAEARRRALEGVPRPLVSSGKLVRDDGGAVVYVREYSDRLLEILLKAHRPGKFRERPEARSELSGPVTLLQLVNASLALGDQRSVTAPMDGNGTSKLIEGAPERIPETGGKAS
jgi:hypothetical protein